MGSICYLSRPKTFQVGTQYLFLEHPSYSPSYVQQVRMSHVEFEAYDVCPALIIVRNGSGERFRCQRDQLFTIDDLV